MELKKIMQDAGMVGAGGAGFPSYAKLSEEANTLLINGAECEPLLYTDYILLRDELPTVIAGILAVKLELNLKEAILCVKHHTAERLELSEGFLPEGGVRVKILPDVYPIGDEVSLSYQATGRLIQPGKLPITEGIIVYNVETMYNLGNMILSGAPVTEKWLTVGGNIDNPTVIKVPVGAKISDIFERLGVTVPDGHIVIDGGPSMGKIINYRTATVTKTTKGILIIPKNVRAAEAKFINEAAAVARAETACCQCTRCTDLCPRHLLGFPLEPHKMVRTAMGAAKVTPELVKTATLCCGCGICESLACSQGISPKAVINNYKALLAQNKMRFTAERTYTPAPEREYRMIPSVKWAQDLGIARFDKVCDYSGKLLDFGRVEIALNKQIGAPSVPAVSTGDRVSAGQIIATAANGLSVPQHASVSGRATVLADRIIIERVNE